MFACTRKDRLFTRTGSPYLALELRDRSGTIQARAFRDADALAGRFERGELVRVSGRVERFRDQPVLEVVDIARVEADAEGSSVRRAIRRGSCRPPTGTSTSSTGSSSTWRARSTTAAFERCSTRCFGDASCGRQWRRAPCTRGGHHAYLGGLLEHTVAVATLALRGLPAAPAAEPGPAADGGARARPRAHARVHLRRRDRADRRGPAARAPRDRRSRWCLARAGALDDERRLALLHCVLCSPRAAAAPGGRFGVGRGAHAVPPERARRRRQGRVRARPRGRDRPRGQTLLGSSGGAARAWWPIQSSKLAGPGSPRLGRFDSFAASSLEMRGFWRAIRVVRLVRVVKAGLFRVRTRRWRVGLGCVKTRRVAGQWRRGPR